MIVLFGEIIDVTGMKFEEALLAFGLSLDDLLEIREQKKIMFLVNSGIQNKIPAREAFESFYVSIQPHNQINGLQPTSVSTYQGILQKFYEYCMNLSGGDMEVNSILDHCFGFLIEQDRHKQFKTNTWNKYVAILRSFAYFVMDQYVVPKRNLPNFRRGRIELPQALSDPEITNLFHFAKQSRYALRAHFMIAFLLSTGLRRDEFRNVQLKDVDLNAMLVHVRHGKGDRARIVNLPAQLIPLLEYYTKTYQISLPDHYLYGKVNDPRFPVSNQAIDQVANRLFMQLPTYKKDDPIHDYHLHVLRHTFATTLLRAGVPLRIIADCLGHRSLLSTQRYTVLDTESIRCAVVPGLKKIGSLIMGGE